MPLLELCTSEGGQAGGGRKAASAPTPPAAASPTPAPGTGHPAESERALQASPQTVNINDMPMLKKIELTYHTLRYMHKKPGPGSPFSSRYLAPATQAGRHARLTVARCWLSAFEFSQAPSRLHLSFMSRSWNGPPSRRYKN